MKHTIFAILSIVLLIPACATKKTTIVKKETSAVEHQCNEPQSMKEVTVFEEEIDSFALHDDSNDCDYNTNNNQAAHTSLVVDERDTETYPFETIYFDFNEMQIREDQKAALQEDIKLAKRAAQEGHMVIIEGHTCTFGTKAYNLTLSLNRANAVKNAMIKEGVPAESIKTVGRGSDALVVPAGDKAQQASNRRVEIYVDLV